MTGHCGLRGGQWAGTVPSLTVTQHFTLRDISAGLLSSRCRPCWLGEPSLSAQPTGRGAQDRVCGPSSVPSTNTLAVEKGFVGDSPLCSLIKSPQALRAWGPQGHADGWLGLTGPKEAPRRVRGVEAPRCAWPISERGQLSGACVRTGATKQRPGGAGGAEAAGRLHGGGPSSLLLYTNRAGVGPQGWQADVGRWAWRAMTAVLRAAILQDVLDGRRSAPLLERRLGHLFR